MTKSINLSESDCTFVHYVLRMYAKTTPGLEQYEKEEIYHIASKFK